MSLGSIQDIGSLRPETLKNELEAVRPEGSGQAFRALLAASAAGKGAINNSAKNVARTAEILQLEMMRSALTLDNSPAPATAVSGGVLNSLLAAYGAGEQKPGGSPEKVSPAVAEVSAGSSSPAPSAPPAVNPAAGPAGPAGSADIATLISRASRRYGVDEGLIKAVIHAESNFKTNAVSHAGAQGLMQLMPATAAGLGVTDAFNPEQNVMAGTRFLKDLLNRYGGDIDKSLAAYNWGPGNVDRGKSRLPQETRDYLVKVKKLYATYSMA
ncbi:MAG: lytic transglycosylase domain-containing protein [Desulfobacteraceae bacterium]|nr:lytic transglycosylase domain-containing protein [Desulfobacteraceae bacterium]